MHGLMREGRREPVLYSTLLIRDDWDLLIGLAISHMLLVKLERPNSEEPLCKSKGVGVD